MKSTAARLTVLCGLSLATAFGQGEAGQSANPAPPAETVAPAIAGVVAAGTEVTVIGHGFQNTEGPVTLPDGSLIFTETRARRITRIDRDDNVST